MTKQRGLESKATLRAKAAVALISRQAGDTPEERILFAVFARAALDAVSTCPTDMAEGAAQYLEGDMPHLQHLGINPSWARAKLTKAQVRLGSYNAGTLNRSEGACA